MITNVVEEARNAILVGDNRTYSNEESKEDEYSNSKALAAKGRIPSKEPIHYGCRQENK